MKPAARAASLAAVDAVVRAKLSVPSVVGAPAPTAGQDTSLPANGTPPGATSGFRIVNRRSGTE